MLFIYSQYDLLDVSPHHRSVRTRRKGPTLKCRVPRDKTVSSVHSAYLCNRISIEDWPASRGSPSEGVQYIPHDIQYCCSSTRATTSKRLEPIKCHPPIYAKAISQSLSYSSPKNWTAFDSLGAHASNSRLSNLAAAARDASSAKSFSPQHR